MTRVQFLNDLYSRLGALEKEQAEEWLVYYAEMLADRMEEGMSEEEAVASMEDIDTIAARILQEAGLPASAMTRPRPAAPPAYPDPPAGGGGGTRGYQPRRQGITLNTVLWIIAGIAVVFAVGRWVYRLTASGGTAMGDPSSSVAIVEVRPDYGEAGVYEFGFEPIPNDGWNYFVTVDGDQVRFFPVDEWGEAYTTVDSDGIVHIQGDTAVDQDADGQVIRDIYEEGYAVSTWTTDNCTGCQIDYNGGEELAYLGIQWPAGSVQVRGWDYEEIAFEEVLSEGSFRDETRLTYEIGDGELRIADAGSASDGAGSKDLTVMVPAWWLEKLEIETQDAGVILSQATMGSVEIKTDSGPVTFDGMSMDALYASTGGGTVQGAINSVYDGEITTGDSAMDLIVHTADELRLESGSGDICMVLYDMTASRTDITTGSGNITLGLPEDTGFTLRWRTSSGDFDGGPFPLIHTTNGRYTSGDEYMRLDVETGSGSLRLEQADAYPR